MEIVLDDNSAYSIGSIYAWWMILRLIVRSLMGFGTVSSNNDIDKDLTET